MELNTNDHANNLIEIKKDEGLSYLSKLEDNMVDLILTDPPYIISRETGMNKHYNNIKENETNNVSTVKTENEWMAYVKKNVSKEEWKKFISNKKDYKDTNEEIYGEESKIDLDNDETYNQQHSNYLKYGSIYGKKYCVKTDYGNWDKDFTLEKIEEFIKIFYKKLRKGGTVIIFFDLWKITLLKEILERNKFKQIRFIEWIKTNPQPLNSRTNYLTNCREIALLGVKNGNPTFNSEYDNGIYRFPLQGGKIRTHPTQKSLKLFEELIKKHSKPNDLVVDPFLGSGTTALACKNTQRRFKGCEILEEYYVKINSIM
jgi:DNA modification methylase